MHVRKRNGRARVARTLTYFTIDRSLRAEMSSREDRTIFEEKIGDFLCTIKVEHMLMHFLNEPRIYSQRVLDPMTGEHCS